MGFLYNLMESRAVYFGIFSLASLSIMLFSESDRETKFQKTPFPTIMKVSFESTYSLSFPEEKYKTRNSTIGDTIIANNLPEKFYKSKPLLLSSSVFDRNFLSD